MCIIHVLYFLVRLALSYKTQTWGGGYVSQGVYPDLANVFKSHKLLLILMNLLCTISH